MPYQDDVRHGRCTYLAAAALAEGLCLIQNGTAKTVAIPTAGTLPLYVSNSAATAAGEQIEVIPISPDTELRVRANGTVTAGDLCEITLSGADAGKVVTLGSGVPRFVAIESAVDEDLFLVRPIPVRPNGANVNIEVLTATRILTAADNGKTLILNSSTEFDTKLPAPALNLEFTFIVGAAPSGASYTVTTNGTTQNVIHAVSASSADAGGSTSGTNGTAVDVITFVDGQAKVGDRVHLICDGTLWYADALMFDEDAITFA